MAIRNLFATPFYTDRIGDTALLADLAHSCHSLAADDRAGRAWAKANGYQGYTSYASLADLPQRDPAFADLKRHLDAHARAFVKAVHFDLGGRKPRLDSLWVNILKPGGSHSGHIHPHSIISGTVYIAVPEGSGRLKIEDPRLPLMMNAPGRTPAAPDDSRPFVYMAPDVGAIYLWESWLRHEVTAGTAKTERISISFNYS